MNRTDWQRWFAWHPVRLLSEIDEHPGFSWVDTGNIAWLHYVERRYVNGRWQHRQEKGQMTEASRTFTSHRKPMSTKQKRKKRKVKKPPFLRPPDGWLWRLATGRDPNR
jgi:hypothetical protein